ncbi:MAG: hypothetical protein F6K28_55470, partial [Microcoleus sp. SIO2G3]|nr:hypothetical protein [Microcoleus sp. SIO2G3]
MSDSSIPADGLERPLLELGLNALRRKDYPTAIAHLTEVCQTEDDRVTLAQAQMALVKAYRRTGELEQARSLCETLSQSSSRKVRTWAIENLAKIDSQAIDQTGFVPLTAPPADAKRERIDLTAPVDTDSIDDSFANPFQLADQ